MFLPALLFIAGAVFFIRLGRYVFSPRFFLSRLKERSPDGKSSLSSLWLALGGTLGVGNICGICAAIYVGGAGCVFWIWVCAFLSAATKYAETVLAVHYREKDTDGNAYGGAPSYIRKALGLKTLPKIFCILCIFTAFTMGNVTQIKTASDFALYTMNIPRYVSASLFFAAVFLLTFGKGKLISAFTSKAVPVLCILYTVLCAVNITVFRENIAPVTRQILSEAFSLRAGTGGILAFLSSPALRLGITRGVMSNEAGCGSAPIAYAADKSASPVRSGMLGITEVLVDTLLLCTLTAYAVLTPQIPLSESSAKTVINVFSTVAGGVITPLIAASVAVFALASASAWAFYAISSAKALGLGKRFFTLFSILYSITAFFACFINESLVWTLADISVSAMAVINTAALLLMLGKVKEITKESYALFLSDNNLKKNISCLKNR